MYIPDKEDSMSKGTKARNNTVWLWSSALLEHKAAVVMSDESAGEGGEQVMTAQLRLYPAGRSV